ncbi:MAG: ParB N-terminal domain-containing protein [Clostridium sp.]|nr:ParB N-terminal domain-containing protein [Clostridium sp.]
MRKGFSSRINDKSKLVSVNADEYKELELDPEQLISAEENFYRIENIQELADNMRLVGHLDPIVVGKVGDQYKIISGHRRREAAVYNKQHGFTEFNSVKCRVKEMTQTMFMLSLISANAFNRKLSDWELVEQARQLKEYLLQAKKEGLVISGRMRDYMADTLGISKTKMAQVDNINNNLCQEGKEALKNGEITFTKAHETAGLPTEKQKEIVQNKCVNASDVKKIKENAVSESDTDKAVETYEQDKRITTVDEYGNWGLINYDIKKVPSELYGALCKLRDYENTELSPNQVTELKDVRTPLTPSLESESDDECTCPGCSRIIEDNDVTQIQYCPMCGQAWKWLRL